MRKIFVRTIMIGTALAAIPLLAQRGGGAGAGHAAAPVTGAAAGAASSAANANRGATAHDSHGVNAAGHPGSSADAALRVSQNQGLSRQLQPLLPAGATLSGAATGFRNQGQFVSALHVAHNLNIPFDQLKAKMTGDDPVSLGKAIQELRPDLNDKTIKDNTRLAARQTDRDLEQSGSGAKPSPFVTRITSNAALSARLQSLLPPGTTLETAAAGFKNEGQFIATLQVSKNLKIPFADLKDRVTAGQSLGQAIQALNPKLTEQASEDAAIQAEDQAKQLRAGVSASVTVPSRP